MGPRDRPTLGSPENFIPGKGASDQDAQCHCFGRDCRRLRVSSNSSQLGAVAPRPRNRRRPRPRFKRVMWSQNVDRCPGFVPEGLDEGSDSTELAEVLAVHCLKCVYKKDPTRRARSELVY